APSATIAMSYLQLPRTAARGAVLAVGDPTFERGKRPAPGSREADFLEAFGGPAALPRLPASGREVRIVARHAVNAMVWRGDAASEAALKRVRLDSVAVLHLATHAVVDDRRPELAALALAPGDGEDGFLGGAELAALKVGGLVVLSGCRTA